MQWSKFSKFAAAHLEMGPLLKWHVSSRLMRMGGDSLSSTIQSWIEQQVDYIAVRPFESLEISNTCARSVNVDITYDLWFHIDGEEQAYARCRGAINDGVDTTVAELINNVKAWHSIYWALQPNRPLVLDAIVRETAHGPLNAQGYCHKALDIYLVPADFFVRLPA